MHFREQAVAVLKNLSIYKINKSNIHELIKDVCKLFDCASSEALSEADYNFLQYISSEVGIPQYYDLLVSKKIYSSDEMHLSDLLSIALNATLYVDDEVLLHRYQKDIYDRFVSDKTNRYFLSAPTSFGKTYIIFELIKKMNYSNVVLIFPTIALLGENYLKLLELKHKSDFWKQYSVHTLSDEAVDDGKNLWIYTPERFMSFNDKNKELYFDFIFIDEIYKIDNQYIIDVETIGESERDISFRIALFETCLKSKDILLAGPYISFPSTSSNKSLEYFINDNNFNIVNYNNIEIVNKSFLSIEDKRQYTVDDLIITIKNKQKNKKLLTVLQSFDQNGNKSKEGTIIYCGRKLETEQLAKYLSKEFDALPEVSQEIQDFIAHLSNIFGNDWIVVNALRHGIGIHHGLVPKYIQREIISLFNRGDLFILISTTTITEGINTTAKNVIIMSDHKGQKELKHFDAQNIAGRAGRFNSHFSGRVISIDNGFMSKLFEDGESLKHKGYDLSSEKNDVDLEISHPNYLTENQKKRKEEINNLVAESGLPDDIINSFKAIRKVDKIDINNRIKDLSFDESVKLENFCRQLVFGTFDWNGFEIICKVLSDFVREDSLKSLMLQPIKNGHLLLTAKVHFYLSGGYLSVIENEKTYYGKSIDSAIREASKMVFNTFRYQLSKYLGIFDLLYRYHLSIQKNISIDDALGLNILIQRLEYGSVIEKAKKVNDYGVPYSIVKYYETEDPKIITAFDAYERKVFNEISNII